MRVSTIVVASLLCLLAVVSARDTQCMSRCKEMKLSFPFCAKYCVASKIQAKKAELSDNMTACSLCKSACNFLKKEDDHKKCKAVCDFVACAAPKNEVQSDSEELKPVTDQYKDELWLKMRSELARVLSQGRASPTLRISNRFINAQSWTSNENFSLFANWVPVYSPSFEYNVDSNLKKAYQEFIESIDVPSTFHKSSAELDQLAQQADDAGLDVDIEEGNCSDNYNKLLARSPSMAEKMPYDNFKVNRCNVLQRKQAVLDDLNYKVHMVTRQFYGQFAELKEAVLKLKTTSNEPPKYRLIESVQNLIDGSKAGRVNTFEVTLARSTKSSKNKWSSLSATVGFGLPSAGLPATDQSGQKTEQQQTPAQGLSDAESEQAAGLSIGLSFGSKKSKLTTSSESFTMSIKGAGYSYFHTVPSYTWFTPGIISQYINGPYRPGFNKDMFFGVNGKMPMMVSGMYMVTQPSVTMSLNRADSEMIEKSKNFGINFAYGPINFNVNKEGGVKTEKQGDDLYKVELTSTSDDPQVWAVDVLIFDPSLRTLVEQA
jgi:hypothetical protein